MRLAERRARPPRRHYILCTAYKNSPFHRLAAQVGGRTGWETSEFDAPHDVVRTDPELVALRIAAIAQGWGLKE